jgi:predicted small secreted protein
MFKKLVTSTIATAFIAGVFATLTGCNTVQGAGKDIERGGEKIQKEAAEHKRY